MYLSSIFVLAVMLVDCLYFLCHHATAYSWERNPVALFLLGFGPLVPVLFRMITTFFAVFIVHLAKPNWQSAAMGVLSGAHAYLAVLYFRILY